MKKNEQPSNMEARSPGTPDETRHTRFRGKSYKAKKLTISDDTFSKVPELLPLRNTALIRTDFKESKYLFEIYIEELKKPLEKRLAPELLSAIFKTATISYMKPFKRDKNRGEKSSYIKEKLITSVPKDLFSVHDALENLRDKHIAHSDKIGLERFTLSIFISTHPGKPDCEFNGQTETDNLLARVELASKAIKLCSFFLDLCEKVLKEKMTGIVVPIYLKSEGTNNYDLSLKPEDFLAEN